MTRIERIEKMFEYLNSDLDKIMDSFILKYAGIEFIRQNTKIDLNISMEDGNTNEKIFHVKVPVEKQKSMQSQMESELFRSFSNDLYNSMSRYCIFKEKN